MLSNAENFLEPLKKDLAKCFRKNVSTERGGNIFPGLFFCPLRHPRISLQLLVSLLPLPIPAARLPPAAAASPGLPAARRLPPAVATSPGLPAARSLPLAAGRGLTPSSIVLEWRRTSRRTSAAAEEEEAGGDPTDHGEKKVQRAKEREGDVENESKLVNSQFHGGGARTKNWTSQNVFSNIRISRQEYVQKPEELKVVVEKELRHRNPQQLADMRGDHGARLKTLLRSGVQVASRLGRPSCKRDVRLDPAAGKWPGGGGECQNTCVVCQDEVGRGDCLVRMPCSHEFHPLI
ncbi:hypothetical protein EJ110_NYTH54948 [Nymphaea thermarum]|nr:hypothetical protein EJ110_NYTH54948 [Nymphaea thermarum]